MIQKYAQFWLFRKGSRNSLPTIFCVTLFKNNVSHVIFQRRSEDTSSVAFEVLIIKSEIDFINLFIFKCLTSNVNLFIFNCLKSNTNYLRDTNKFLRSRTLCTNILKCKFPTKGIELTRLEFFEGPRGPQLWGTWFRPFR